MLRGGSRTFTFRVVVLVFVCITALAPTATTAAAVTTTSQPHDCFPASGTDFVVGTEGPQLRFTHHLWLFPAVVTAEPPTPTNGPGGNATAPAGVFGIEATATANDVRVISLRSGVVFEGSTGVGRLVADPFDPFAFVFDYRLTISVFEGTTADADYRATDVPVDGPVEEAACSN
jgi:DNA-binding beta-propeller fold protein YncE